MFGATWEAILKFIMAGTASLNPNKIDYHSYHNNLKLSTSLIVNCLTINIREVQI